MNAELIKIFALCIITVGVTVLLRQYKPEYAFLCLIAGGVVILFSMVSNIGSAISQLYALCGENPQISFCFKIAVKALGISYLTTFTSDLCQDFGQSALALKAELCGKIAIFLLAVPLLKTILELAVGMIKI